MDDFGNKAIHLAISTDPGKGSLPTSQFVRNLLEHIDPNSLPTLVDSSGFNPLHIAAWVGHTAAARMLVNKNPRLLFIYNNLNRLPIHLAIGNSRRDTFLYLLDACKQYTTLSREHGFQSLFDGQPGVKFLSLLIEVGYVDVAYDLVKEYPNMARGCYNNFDHPLLSITRNLDTYCSGSQYNFYQRFDYSHASIPDKKLGNNHQDPVQDIENQETYKNNFYKCKRSCFHDVLHLKCLKEDKMEHNTARMLLKCVCKELAQANRQSDVVVLYCHATTQAAQNNNSEVIEELVRYFPQAIFAHLNGVFLIQLAITNRSEKVYNLLIHEKSMNKNKYFYKGLSDKDDNNLLHLAGRLAPVHKLNMVSGAALQMQRELQWFEEVGKLVLPNKREEKNQKQETPMMVFRSEHKGLRKEGEEWMKKTADSYTITAGLIITIVFAAAITVPGGNSDTGKAIYAAKPSFIIFAISDAIHHFLAVVSIYSHSSLLR